MSDYIAELYGITCGPVDYGETVSNMGARQHNYIENRRPPVGIMNYAEGSNNEWYHRDVDTLKQQNNLLINKLKDIELRINSGKIGKKQVLYDDDENNNYDGENNRNDNYFTYNNKRTIKNNYKIPSNSDYNRDYNQYYNDEIYNNKIGINLGMLLLILFIVLIIMITISVTISIILKIKVMMGNRKYGANFIDNY